MDWEEANTRAGFAAAVMASAQEVDDATRVIELAGGRVVARLPLEETGAAEPLDDTEAGVLLVEIETVAPALLPALLARVEALLDARQALHAVVVLDPRDIDAVAGSLMGMRVQLLCAPDPVERVAALLVAARGGGEPTPLVRESDGERLQRISTEIARIAAALAKLTDGPAAPDRDGVGDRRPNYDSGRGVDMADPQAIRRAIRTRRLRDGYFPAGLFEDPAWDMLLDLFAAELEGARVSVSSLCIAAAVAPTTALRWIGRMTEVGLLARAADPQDRRRAYMMLTDRARRGLRDYIAAASRAGLSIG